MTGLVSRCVRVGRSVRRARRKTANNVVTGLACAVGASALMTFGCIDRPIVPSKPNTTNLYVNQIEMRKIEAIDLLFVVDNSISMADKQKLLRDAVPLMVSRLITPDCVDDRDGRHPSDGQGCSSYGPEFFPEFRPVNDIHLGVITSSIGGFGADYCNDPVGRPDDLDKSRLIPKVRDVVAATGEPVPNPTGLGFLSWTGADSQAETELALEQLEHDLSLHVAAAGETGCGFEAPLEAWYRFLVDPEPPLEVVVQGEDGSVSTGIDESILEQRAEFLRPGSLVAIVVLTDENDCSVMEGGNAYPFASSGWVLPTLGSNFTVASAACDENPNDRCCHSCKLPAPEGCEETCTRPTSPVLDEADDRAGVRCFDGKRRFGVDLLYPTDRYVDGLSKPTIVNSRTGALVQNPLLADRTPDLIFFAGIVGVPWQDVATDSSLSDPATLEYRSARELHTKDDALAATRWELLLGRPGRSEDAPECRTGEGLTPHADCGLAPSPPLDPFMIESIHPRSGVHPLTGDAIVAQGSSGWSPINGHEYDNSVEVTVGNDPTQNDLQYSCIFPLDAAAVKEDCTFTDACDCSEEPGRNRPLCKPTPSASVAADTTQRYGKAYPPTRILRVLRDFGDNSIVASICPKIIDQDSPSFGYNPAVNAIVDRLIDKLGGQCLPRPLDIEQGEVPCVVLEATRETTACDANQRRADVDEAAQGTVEKRLESSGVCKRLATDERPLPLCSEFRVCEILEVEAEDKPACFGTMAADQQAPGYCYIDPAKGPSAGGLPTTEGACVAEDDSTWGGCTSPHIVGCDPTERRILRFVGQETPLPNSTTFVACAGDAASEDKMLPPLPPPTP